MVENTPIIEVSEHLLKQLFVDFHSKYTVSNRFSISVNGNESNIIVRSEKNAADSNQVLKVSSIPLKNAPLKSYNEPFWHAGAMLSGTDILSCFSLIGSILFH